MRVEEHVPLASLTTFRIGGPATLVATCDSNDDIKTALALARERGLPVYPLGEGSNVLAADEGVEKLILRHAGTKSLYEEEREKVRVIADAGMHWDTLVTESAARNLWGFENLAGIPGTVGASPVQNVGAYGREVGDTLEWVEVYDMRTDEVSRLRNAECAFAYRESRFKAEPHLLITRVAFLLSSAPDPRTDYPDLRALTEQGRGLGTPSEIAAAVREVRGRKFPDLRVAGTAGSFFKNPVIDAAHAAELLAAHPGLPTFPAGKAVKVPLAWILDRVLGLRGFAHGPVRLFENQPLVVVAEDGATKRDVDALADIVTKKVFDATRITIEREVRTLL